MHADLKEENFQINSDLQFKIFDFGIGLDYND